jgi:DNA-binding NarL/FixJ family response regulator
MIFALVDDSPLFLDGLRNVLLARGFIVVGEAQDGLEAQEQARELVATGMQYKEVADTLHLSEASIKYHMNQILGRLHLENRQQAISYAIRLKSKKKG